MKKETFEVKFLSYEEWLKKFFDGKEEEEECKDCEGTGETECMECGNIGTCQECDGSGFEDGTRLDYNIQFRKDQKMWDEYFKSKTEKEEKP